jgi:hypothetical protein
MWKRNATCASKVTGAVEAGRARRVYVRLFVAAMFNGHPHPPVFGIPIAKRSAPEVWHFKPDFIMLPKPYFWVVWS